MCPIMNRPRICSLEAIGRDPVLQSANLGPAGRLSISVQQRDEPGPWWTGQDQIETDSQPRSRRMGFAAEAEMDAVGDLQPILGTIRPL
jgi:hypothetical protein